MSVGCGHRHVIGVSENGDVYGWGMGSALNYAFSVKEANNRERVQGDVNQKNGILAPLRSLFRRKQKTQQDTVRRVPTGTIDSPRYLFNIEDIHVGEERDAGDVSANVRDAPIGGALCCVGYDFNLVVLQNKE